MGEIRSVDEAREIYRIVLNIKKELAQCQAASTR